MKEAPRLTGRCSGKRGAFMHEIKQADRLHTMDGKKVQQRVAFLLKEKVVYLSQVGYQEGFIMEIKDVLRNLRESHHLTQDQMAERVMVSRQAVSRWENGETQPNTDTLKILSREFDVSINTLLGSPRQLICQCCGMPLSEDGIISKEFDGSFNEDYCKWCYADGTYMYDDMDDLIDVCVGHMVNESFTEEQARAYMKQMLPKLDYWKRYGELSDDGQFSKFKKQLIEEINGLHIEGLPKVEKLNALVGKFVNLEYRLPNGMKVKFLDDQTTYLGNQLESEFGGDRCFGILANMDFIMVCTYGKEGADPELVLYKKRMLGEVKVKAFIDKLTGAQSINAYRDNEQDINGRIKAGKMQPFALVVCDVNDLKKVNDRLGHQAGDDHLRSAFHLLRDIFSGCPIYRVGGDEFVVLLEGENYEKRKTMTDRLDSANREHLQTGEVQVSAGLSEWQRNDEPVASVFARADISMYKKKSEMKAMNGEYSQAATPV